MVHNKESATRARPLKEIQSFVWQAIVRPLTMDYDMRKRWIDGRDSSVVANDYIRPNNSLTSFERLQIYNQQYWYRLLDCFEDDYPGLKAILGIRRFTKLSKEYLTTHPSNSFSLRDLGRELETFLEERTELIEPEIDLCLELAKFEWAQIVAFDGPALTPLTEQDIRGAQPDQLIVALQPYMTLLELNHLLDDYSIALTRHERDRSEAGSDKKRTLKEKTAPWPVSGKVFLAVHRHENTVYFKRLEPAGFVMLSSLSRGRSLSDAIMDAVSYLEEHELKQDTLQEDIQNWFALWMRLGWLCSPSS